MLLQPSICSVQNRGEAAQEKQSASARRISRWEFKKLGSFFRPDREAVERGSLVFGYGDLLLASVKITAYNQHCSAPFFRAPVV